jgi:hypothetical protein
MVRLNSSLAVDSPMPPVPPTKIPIKSLIRWPCALEARTLSLETIWRGAPLEKKSTASTGGLSLRRSPMPSQSRYSSSTMYVVDGASSVLPVDFRSWGNVAESFLELASNRDRQRCARLMGPTGILPRKRLEPSLISRQARKAISYPAKPPYIPSPRVWNILRISVAQPLAC